VSPFAPSKEQPNHKTERHNAARLGHRWRNCLGVLLAWMSWITLLAIARASDIPSKRFPPTPRQPTSQKEQWPHK